MNPIATGLSIDWLTAPATYRPILTSLRCEEMLAKSLIAALTRFKWASRHWHKELRTLDHNR